MEPVRINVLGNCHPFDKTEVLVNDAIGSGSMLGFTTRARVPVAEGGNREIVSLAASAKAMNRVPRACFTGTAFGKLDGCVLPALGPTRSFKP